MAGSLIKIDEEIVTSAVASVTLTGIDSTYDVYMLKLNNVLPSADAVLEMQVTVSGSADTSANYDNAKKLLRSDTSFSNLADINQTDLNFSATLGSATNEGTNGFAYLFNFNNASEYSFGTIELSGRDGSGNLRGSQGGFVHTVAQSCDGVLFKMSTGNIASGTFNLYALKK